METSLALMKQEFVNFSKLFDRMQDSMEKITANSSDVARLLALHEQRLEDLYQQDRVLETKFDGKHIELTDQMKDLHSHIRNNNRDVMDRMKSSEDTIRSEIKHVREYIEQRNNFIQTSIDDHRRDAEKTKEDLQKRFDDFKAASNNRLSALERWRWLLGGAMAVIIWFINKFPGVIDIL